MGSTNSKLKKINKIKMQQWRLIQSEHQQPYYQDIGSRQAQLNYATIHSNISFDEQLLIYNERRNTSMPLIKCYGAQQIQSSGVSGTKGQILVLIERIIRRWQNFYQLTFPEIIYVLQQTLQGYKYLYQKVGAFRISQAMFGINRKGFIKVWLNQDFAINHPIQRIKPYNAQNHRTNSMKNCESSMVKQILDFVEERCEQGRYPKIFRQQIHQNSITFEKCQRFLKQYVINRKIMIPQAIHPNSNKMYQISISPKYQEKQSQKAFWQNEKLVQSQYIQIPQMSHHKSESQFHRGSEYNPIYKSDISQMTSLGNSQSISYI